VEDELKMRVGPKGLNIQMIDAKGGGSDYRSYEN